MSKYDEAIASYKEELTKLKVNVDEKLLDKITKGLGPSIYLKDASVISCTDQGELDRVKKNFLTAKLGMTDDTEMDKALKAVCEQYKANQRRRAVFYYLLVLHLKKESLFV